MTKREKIRCLKLILTISCRPVFHQSFCRAMKGSYYDNNQHNWPLCWVSTMQHDPLTHDKRPPIFFLNSPSMIMKASGIKEVYAVFLFTLLFSYMRYNALVKAIQC